MDSPVGGAPRCDVTTRFGDEVAVGGLGTLDFQQSISLTADERTAYVALAGKAMSGAPDFDIYKATRAGDSGDFGTPTRFGLDTAMPEPDVAISGDGKLMVLTRPGSGGDLDLFESDADTSGAFTTASRIDAASATGLDDLYPTLAADGSALYFSSYTDTNKNQVYVSSRINGSFGAPALVSGINSADYENGAVLSTDRLQVVFSRSGQLFAGIRSSVADGFAVAPLLDVRDAVIFGQATWLSADGCHLYYQTSTYDPGNGATLSTRIYVRSRSL
ncbi:MAG TPA: hypothetical protein VGC42_03050 [Kofleriaceae bacterium]